MAWWSWPFVGCIYHFELCVFNLKNPQIQILNWKYFEFYLNLNVDLMVNLLSIEIKLP